MFVKCLMQRSFFFTTYLWCRSYYIIRVTVFVSCSFFFLQSLSLQLLLSLPYKNVIYITWLAGRSKKKAGQCNIHAKKKKAFLLKYKHTGELCFFMVVFVVLLLFFFLLSFLGKACIMLRCNMSEKYVCIPQMATEAIAIMES